MSTYQNNAVADYRNENWGITGASSLHAAWSDSSDTTYASCPGNKGRGAATYVQDISSGNIPDGSSIESVTVFCRAARTDTTSRRLTINVLPTDNTAYFHSRTIALSQTITTYEVGTYTKDAHNRPWTKDTLNQIALQCFTYDSGGSTDKIRVHELYCSVNYRTKPVVTITAPTGTVTTSAPVVTYTYTQTDGDIQAYATYKIYTADQVAAVTFNPDVTPSAYPAKTTYTVKSGDSLWSIAARFYGNGELWPTLYAASTLRSGDPNLIFPGEIVTVPGIGTVQGDITSFTLPFALSAGDYYIYLKVTSTHGCTSAWASHEFIVGGSGSGNPGAPGGSLGGIGTGGGGGFESVIADGPTSNVYLALRDGSNLLGVQGSNFETLTDGIGWVGTNCVLSQDLTVEYDDGGASMKMVASSAATMSAVSNWHEVVAGAPLTLRAQSIAIATGRTVNVSVAFADDTFTTVGSTFTATVTDATTTWTEAEVTNFTVPAGATLAQITLQVVSPANAEVHNFDHIGLMYGTDSAWSNGGHASRNLLTAYAANAEDPSADPMWVADSGSTVTRPATTGTGSDGTKAFKVLYAGTAGSISVVATGTAYTDTTTTSSVTLNKPAGVADGDVLVAYVATDGPGFPAGTAPTGWTMVQQQGTATSALMVMMRDGLAADPTTWTGTLASNRTRCRTSVVAYRGAASTATQFARNNMSTSLSGSLSPQTPTVNNSDPNAWRLSAFAIDGTSTGGSITANITPSGTAQPIAYVGKGTTARNSNSGSSFTINKPTGTASGHLMVATLVMSQESGTISAPSGWTILDTTKSSRGTGDTDLCVIYRFAGVSEPSSWTGSTSGSYSNYVCASVAYSNVNSSTPWISHGGQVANAATFSTPVKTNTSSNSWWVAAFGDVTQGGSSINASGTERTDDTNSGSVGANVSIHDSNGKISTGNTSATAVASNDQELYSSCAWIGILNATSTGSTPGGNETLRQGAVAGASNPCIDLAAYDSNGVAPTGNTTIYGTYTAGGSVASSVGFLGFLLPGTASVSGEAGCTLSPYINLRNIDAAVRSAVGNTVSLEMAALGSVAGTPHVKLYAYSGNELLSSQVQEGIAFGTSTWSTSILKFIVPSATTRLKMGVSMINCAVNDYMLFDRVQMALGSTDTYRSGTGSTAHPIYSVPVIEYAEDLGVGYGDWLPLAGTGGTPFTYDPNTGLCTLVDQTMTPLSNRKYRAKTVSYGLAGDRFVSPYGPESPEVTLYASEWWLKDMTNQDLSMQLKVYLNSDASGGTGSTGSTFTTSDTSATFQPLGRSRPVVVTEGYKGDIIPLVLIMDSQEFAQLNELFAQRHTLYLQSNIDKAWWVRPTGDLAQAILPTGSMNVNPMRYVTVTFIEVDPAV